MAILIVFICIFNVVMWIIFLQKFKKLFTTDDVIENAKSELNKIISDMNRNVERNINLTDASAQRLKELVSEAEKKIKILSDMEKQEIALSDFNNRVYEQKAAEKAYTKKNITRIKPEDSFSLTPKAKKEPEIKQSQKTLFDDEVRPIETVAKVTVTDNGASYAEIPVVSPKVYKSETPLKINRHDDLKTKIIHLYDIGNSIEDIAAELSCSTTEVQFALTLENRI